jgi:hypothetical protein
MTTGEPKRNWKERLLEELRNLSITVIYLWVLFSVFDLHRAIILADLHISAPARLGFALINALILAKFILLFSADSSLITDKEVRGVGIGFGQTLLGQLGINGVGDLLLHERIWFIGTLNVNPLVGLECSEVGFAVEVVTNILRQQRRTTHQKQNERKKNQSFHSLFSLSFATKNILPQATGCELCNLVQTRRRWVTASTSLSRASVSAESIFLKWARWRD